MKRARGRFLGRYGESITIGGGGWPTQPGIPGLHWGGSWG